MQHLAFCVCSMLHECSQATAREVVYAGRHLLDYCMPPSVHGRVLGRGSHHGLLPQYIRRLTVVALDSNVHNSLKQSKLIAEACSNICLQQFIGTTGLSSLTGCEVQLCSEFCYIATEPGSLP